MKRFYKIFASWFLCLFLVFSQFIVSLADVKSLMIGSDSNALMTMELDDSDYLVMPMSSIGTVTNTIDWSNTFLQVYLYNVNTSASRYINFQITDFDASQAEFKFDMEKQTIYTAADGWQIAAYGFILYSDNLPSSGSYSFSMDVGSSFSFDYDNLRLVCSNDIANASTASSSLEPNFTYSSGDLYVAPYNFTLTNLDRMIIRMYVHGEGVVNVGGSVRVCFTPIASGNYPSTGVVDTTQSEIDSQISGSLFDLSSSVDTMTDEISGVTDAIQNLQGAMEPHYSNVLTQLHHITEQLHAFYDQVYNNIHLPELDMLTQIKTAIENIDLQIEVDISEVKTAINNMSTAVQSKLQATTDQITGGYDNSSMSSDKSELDGVLDQYEQAEEQLFDDAKGHINDFEFNTPLDSFTGPLADVSYFLNGMFEAMGPMNVVISFSLTLTIAMVMIGWYRFKGGR